MAEKGKSKNIYVAYTHDEYELPVAVADTAAELAKMVGITRQSLYTMLTRKEGHYRKIKENDE